MAFTLLFVELVTSRRRDFVGDWNTSPRIVEFFCAQLLQPLTPLGGCLPVEEDWWGWPDTSVLLHTSIGCSMIVQSVQSQHFNHLGYGDQGANGCRNWADHYSRWHRWAAVSASWRTDGVGGHQCTLTTCATETADNASNTCIAVCKVDTPLQELTCHMGSHSVTCHPFGSCGGEVD